MYNCGNSRFSVCGWKFRQVMWNISVIRVTVCLICLVYYWVSQGVLESHCYQIMILLWIMIDCTYLTSGKLGVPWTCCFQLWWIPLPWQCCWNRFPHHHDWWIRSRWVGCWRNWSRGSNAWSGEAYLLSLHLQCLFLFYAVLCTLIWYFKNLSANEHGVTRCGWI